MSRSITIPVAKGEHLIDDVDMIYYISYDSVNAIFFCKTGNYKTNLTLREAANKVRLFEEFFELDRNNIINLGHRCDWNKKTGEVKTKFGKSFVPAKRRKKDLLELLNHNNLRIIA